jgi:hypothetical protein
MGDEKTLIPDPWNDGRVRLLGAFAMLLPDPTVKANFDHVENGMTMAEVERIFGGKGIRSSNTRKNSYSMNWKAENGSCATITFRDDCVVNKTWEEPEETFLDKIRRLLHLR